MHSSLVSVPSRPPHSSSGHSMWKRSVRCFPHLINCHTTILRISGYSALFIEANLGTPQALRNYKRKSTTGMRYTQNALPKTNFAHLQCAHGIVLDARRRWQDYLLSRQTHASTILHLRHHTDSHRSPHPFSGASFSILQFHRSSLRSLQVIFYKNEGSDA